MSPALFTTVPRGPVRHFSFEPNTAGMAGHYTVTAGARFISGFLVTLSGFGNWNIGQNDLPQMETIRRSIFITGGTGYLGRVLIPELLARGHEVHALTRPGSEKKLPGGCQIVTGDALDGKSFADKIAPADTFVQLVGVPHPNPAKAAQFRTIDFVSVRESAAAAAAAKVRHFIYLSVAQPAPVMREYLAVRAEGEAMVRAHGLNATFVRPLYVLGPGHWWPYFVLPIFWLFELAPSKRAAARRLKPVTLAQTLATLVHAVENPADGIRIVEAEEMRRGRPLP